MHSRHLLMLGALLGSTVLLSSCLSGSKLNQTQQFLVEPTAQIEKVAATPHTLGVRPLVGARVYTLSMLFTDADGALVPYADAAWAEAPANAVTRALRDAVQQTGRFADAGDAAEMARPEYALTGELRKFHEDRSVTPPRAVVEVRLELRQALGAKLLWADTLNATVPLSGNKPSDLAAAMTKAVAELSTHAAAGIAATPLP